MPPRRPGEITQLERDILAVAAQLDGSPGSDGGWFWAYGIAAVLEGRYDRQSLLDHGTIYKVLKAMSAPERVLLESRIEGDDEAKSHRGPARRYYRIAPTGRETLERAEARPSIAEHRDLFGAGPGAPTTPPDAERS